MPFNAHQSFLISDRSYMSSAKRDISRLAELIGFDEEQKGRIDIVVSELTSNLIKHGTTGGEILVKKIGEKIAGIEILCLDNGPGMHDIKRMMEDGISTYGSKGEGLGAIKRLSHEFDIYSLPGIGTFILSRIYIKNNVPVSAIKFAAKKLDIGTVIVPKAGEFYSGDGAAELENNNHAIVMAVDGLGHGKDAHAASNEAIKAFTGCTLCLPSDILKYIHQSIKKTRGVVGAIATINIKEETMTFCGIGNISGRLFTEEGPKSLLSYNGTLGHNIPGNFNNHSFKWKNSSLLILHSDGLKSRWDFSKYPGLEKHDSSLIAATIYKDNTRKTDDALVMVVRTL